MKRVFAREEFEALLVERCEDVLSVGKVLKFVESVLKLQNDYTRPVYVFEVDKDIAQEDIEFIDRSMDSLGIACVLVPRGLMSYVGEVDSISFGQENLSLELLGAKRKDVKDGR